MRETVDGSYLLRASKLLDGVLATDANNYEALRQRTEVELFRHEFAKVIEESLRLQDMRPGDSWNLLLFATLIWNPASMTNPNRLTRDLQTAVALWSATIASLFSASS